jgi:hypothetical protein
MRSVAGGRARRVLASVVLAVCVVLAVSGASSARVHPFVGSFGSFGNPQAVAVDQASGDVFVLDVGSASVQKFDASGNAVDFSALGSNTLDGAGGADATPEGGFSFDSNSAAQVAVDNSGGSANGDLYVANSFAGVIDVFDSTGTFVGEINGSAATPQSGGETCGVATDPAGDVYSSSFNGHVDKYTPTDSDPTHDTFDGQLESLGGVCNVAADGLGNVYVSTWDVGPLTKYPSSQLNQDPSSGTVLDATSKAVAVDPSNNDVYVDHGDQIAQYDSSGTQLGQSGGGQLAGSSFGVAIHGSTGDLYASDVGSGVVDHFGPLPPPVPPTVTGQAAQDITPSRVALTGLVNPNGMSTTYYFEYGPTTAYGTSVPVTHDGDAGLGSDLVAVVRRISGLQPGTTYHFRLVATNVAGTTPGQDQMFTTTTPPPPSSPRAGIPGTGFLPDNRGWEKVSPNDKNGADIIGDSQITRVASDGSAVGYASLGAFAGAVGTGISTDYMATRSSRGWETHAITPPQAPLTIKPILVNLASQYVGDFSSDLSKGVFLGWSPVTSDPDVANVANLYLRTDLRTPGAGFSQLITACPLCQGTPLPAPLGNSTGAGKPYLAGTSADLGHVLFESQQRLTSDAPTGCNNQLNNRSQCPGSLYDWDHGTVRLAGILPDDQCASPPCPAEGSQAGRGAGSFGASTDYTPHTISSDGSRIIFTVPGDPNVYMRVDHATTIRLNASERTDCADHNPCNGTPEPDPGGAQQTTYWDASVDGSRVFFTTHEALTSDAPPNGSGKLYMYDASKPASDPHNLTFLSPDNEPGDSSLGSVVGVAAVSNDGHYLYFTAFGALVAGQPIPTGAVRGLYVWHDGTVRFITPIDQSDVRENATTGDWTFITRVSQATPDGAHLLFSSTESQGPTGFDQTCATQGGGLCRQLYLYSYASQRLVCVSCNQDVSHANTLAFSNEVANNGGAFTSWGLNHPMSVDGQRVFFSTAEPLVPQDVNGRADSYEYDVPTGTLHLLSSGRGTSNSYFLNASASGDDAFFVTRDQLTGADVDSSYDLYDARVGGGFPEPPPNPPVCSSESCRPPQAEAPSVPSGNGQVMGNDNVPSVKKVKPKTAPCRRGYVRKKVHGKAKCVKKPRRRARKTKGSKARRANSAHGRAK